MRQLQRGEEGVSGDASEAVTQARRRLKAILNKITLATFDQLSRAFVRELDAVAVAGSHGDERLRELVAVVFEHVLAAPMFCPVFAALCQHVCCAEQPLQAQFGAHLLQTCRIRLQRGAAIDERHQHVKRDYLAYIRFWGDLFVAGASTQCPLVGVQALHSVLEDLVRRASAVSLEALCKLLTALGKLVEQLPGHRERLDMYFSAVERIVAAGNLAPRLRFMLVDLMELRQHEWVPRRPAVMDMAAAFTTRQATLHRKLHELVI